MSSEEKAPYYSKRIRIGDITSPKDLIGYKDFTLELIFGNMDTRVFKNKKDVAEVIEEKTMFDIASEVFGQRDIWAKKLGFRFVDQREKVE